VAAPPKSCNLPHVDLEDPAAGDDERGFPYLPIKIPAVLHVRIIVGWTAISPICDRDAWAMETATPFRSLVLSDFRRSFKRDTCSEVSSCVMKSATVFRFAPFSRSQAAA
jgi:hypothetical protein